MSLLQNVKPGAPKSWLFILSGITWSSVGLILCQWCVRWWRSLTIDASLPLVLIGASLAFATYTVGFSRLARQNIQRINELPQKPCLFAFQAWHSYPLVVVMITLGILLRHSPLPKALLGILYAGIGGGLLMVSLHYYLARLHGMDATARP
jgi:drug/metabolite transporter (DMT)-like permease